MNGKRRSQPGTPVAYTSPHRMRSPEASMDYSTEAGTGPRDVMSGEQKAVVVLVSKIVSKVSFLMYLAYHSCRVIPGRDWVWLRWMVASRPAWLPC
jgi:hypothetical protein